MATARDRHYDTCINGGSCIVVAGLVPAMLARRYMRRRRLPKQITHALTGRTVRCILFDLGETLWTLRDDTTLQHLDSAAYERVLAALHGHTPSLSPVATLALYSQIKEALEEYIHNARRQRAYYEPDFTLATSEVLQQVGLSGVTPELSAAVFEALRVSSSESRVPFPDTFSTLETLRARGFLLGIVSNRNWGGELFQQDLQILGFFEYFDPSCIAISADLGIRKPNPDIFLRVLNALDVAPHEAVMVGDSLRADVAGAKKLGMFTVWKPSRRLRAALAAEMVDDVLQSHLTEEERLLAYAQHSARVKYGPSQDDMQPHLVIAHLHELLAIFVEPGVQ
ncbi:MAG: HAD family hydrolase [Ktedonobacteraceae bacterium]|nr:HAD family hydrolase [Ktedonobacteraceae bacterium]